MGKAAVHLPRIVISAICAGVSGLALHDSAAQLKPPAAATSSVTPGRDWAVEPTVPGENLPEVGRSLFDFLVVRNQGGHKVYDVPFPISTLMKKLENELQPDVSGTAPLKTVLIPLGRSLQRASAAPDFFAYPRVVLAADAEPRLSANNAGILLKDRIYLGYQEKAELIEVISYNEAAGRFEFQVVKDYRPGGAPKVFYANRAICTACHQNAAPIFSRQLWDETNANREVAALLRKQKRTFYGIEPDRGVDVPYGLDNATDRANLFAAYQLLWRNGCEIPQDKESTLRCRAGLYTAALQYRLSGRQHFDRAAGGYREHVVPVLTRNAREYWPTGLRIPNPDLPNRDPFLPSGATLAVAKAGSGVLPRGSLAEGVDVHAAFDPLAPRAPLEIWQVADGATFNRLIAGLSEFIAESDARALSAHLHGLAARRKAVRARYESACEITRTPRSAREYRIDFQCPISSGPAQRTATLHGRFYVASAKAPHGTIVRLGLTEEGQPNSEIRDLDITGGSIARRAGRYTATLQLARAGMHARRADGNALETLQITWGDTAPGREAQRIFAGRAVVTVLHDFAPVHAAIENMIRDTAAGNIDVFSNKPFRRASLMPALFDRAGMKPLAWCCVNDAAMPQATMESDTGVTHPRADAAAKPLPLQPFFRYCATCHQSNERSPPNFLQGSATAVAANLAHCAQRLHVRLSMWQLAPEQRPKTPMPPHYALYGFHVTPQAWRDSAELAALRAYVERALQAEYGKAPPPDELVNRGYENLRACLPEPS